MNIKFIDNYKEFEGDSGKSVKDHISTKAIPGKEKILSYLKSFPVDGVRCSTLYDFVEDVLYTPTVFFHTDGEYSWDDEETYHFEKYNMELDKAFINKILTKA